MNMLVKGVMAAFPRLSSSPSLSEALQVARTPPVRDGAIYLATQNPAVKAKDDF